jgi:hypothetical protein
VGLKQQGDAPGLSNTHFFIVGGGVQILEIHLIKLQPRLHKEDLQPSSSKDSEQLAHFDRLLLNHSKSVEFQ